MDKNKDLQDYIDLYRSGKVTEAEFQKRMIENPELKEEFKIYQRDLTLIRASVKESLKEKAAVALEKHEAKPRNVFSLKRVMQIAAALVFLVLSYVAIQQLNQPNSNADLFASYFELPSPAGERNATAQSEVWNESMVAYSNEDYKKTIDSLSPLVAQNDFLYPDRAKLFLGISYLMEGEATEAIGYFDAISTESSYSHEAEWYKALSFLKIEKKEEAKTVFQKIASQPSHFKFNSAQEILKKLK